MEKNLFLIAAKKKYRFESSKGELTTEQLFDLPKQSTRGASLDEVYRKIKSQIKDSEGLFESTNDRVQIELKNKLELIKEIASIREKENEQKIKMAKIKEIDALIAEHEEKELMSNPEKLRELRAQLASGDED